MKTILKPFAIAAISIATLIPAAAAQDKTPSAAYGQQPSWLPPAQYDKPVVDTQKLPWPARGRGWLQFSAERNAA